MVRNGSKLLGGSLTYLESLGMVGADMKARAAELAGQGKTPLLFARDGKLAGMIAVADVIKEDSARAIQELKNMGIEVVMVTGDNERTAETIGRQAGVDRVIAGVLPEGKETVIRQLQKAGTVAMVGDGINDAPALTRADLGIAIGAGADVAIDSADIVLMNSRLTDVSAAVRLSRGTVRNIHENLFWAFFYNVLLIPCAAGLYSVKMNPMLGAAAMSISSFTVCMNALRLNLFKIHDASHDKKRENRARAMVESETFQVARPQVAADGGHTVVLDVKGMMCAHCEAHVKKNLEALDGVISAKADHTTGRVEVRESREVPENDFKSAILKAGYEYEGIEA